MIGYKDAQGKIALIYYNCDRINTPEGYTRIEGENLKLDEMYSRPAQPAEKLDDRIKRILLEQKNEAAGV
jgi:hypothetical protein